MKYKIWIYVIIILLIIYLGLIFFKKEISKEVSQNNEKNISVKLDNITWEPIYKDKVSIGANTENISKDSVKTTNLIRK